MKQSKGETASKATYVHFSEVITNETSSQKSLNWIISPRLNFDI